jgi:hypothetical protein
MQDWNVIHVRLFLTLSNIYDAIAHTTCEEEITHACTFNELPYLSSQGNKYTGD